MSLYEELTGKLFPKAFDEFYLKKGLFRMKYEDFLAEIGTCHKSSKSGKITYTADKLVYGQGLMERLKLWARTPKQQEDVDEAFKRIGTHRQANFKSYRGRNIGALLKHMDEEEAEATIKSDFDRIAYKFWDTPPNVLSANVLWCVTFEPWKIAREANRISEARKAEGTFDLLIDHTHLCPYDPSTEVLGAGFYPSLKIRFRSKEGKK